MTQKQRELNLYWHDRHKHIPAIDMTDYFLENAETCDTFFAYLHYFESHWPFYTPSGQGDEEQRRKEAVLCLDEQVGRVLDKFGKDCEIIATSDHNIPPGKVSAAYDVPSPSTMLAYISSNFKASKPWTDYGPHPNKIAGMEWNVPSFGSSN